MFADEAIALSSTLFQKEVHGDSVERVKIKVANSIRVIGGDLVLEFLGIYSKLGIQGSQHGSNLVGSDCSPSLMSIEDLLHHCKKI